MVLSAVSIPINYGPDSAFSLAGGNAYTFDNYTIYDAEILKKVVDISYNKKQLVALTDNIKLNELVAPEPPVPLEKIITKSYITTNSGQYVVVTSPNNPSSSSIVYNSTGPATIFTFEFNPSAKTVRIYYKTNNDVVMYLTGTGDYNSNLSASPVDTTEYNTFYYILSGDSITLFSYATKNIVQYNDNRLIFSLLYPAAANVLPIQTNAILRLNRFVYSNHNYIINTFGQSDNIRYNAGDDNITIRNSTDSINYNYLITAAYENVSGGITLDVNINNLKNYYSPRHAQTVNLSEQLRSYKKIFTGLNEDGGYENIFLTYNSSTLEQTFIPDVDNYFHYPYGSSVLQLSASLLTESGSYGDFTPARSDRLFKKQANYAKNTNWGTSSVDRGVYFCSWLSASNFTSTPVWVDRYYDPAYLNLIYPNISLSGTTLIESTNNWPNIIWDKPSTLTFEPGVLYYYHRKGELENDQIITRFPGLIYHINDWKGTLTNATTNAVIGAIDSFSVSLTGQDQGTRGPYFKPTNTYGYLNTTLSDFENNTGNTFSFFLYQDDWTNIVGDQIVGNHFNGGFGLFNSNSILTPTFNVRTGTQIKSYNADLELLDVRDYTTFNNTYSAVNFILKSTYDSFYYVVDSSAYAYMARFDVDNLINFKLSLGTYALALTSDVSSITNAWLVPNLNNPLFTDLIVQKRTSNTSVEYYRFSNDGVLIRNSTIDSSTVYNNFAINLSGDPIFYNSPYNTDAYGVSIYGTNSCVDSNSTVFALSGDYIIRGKTTAELTSINNAVIKITSAESIYCDQEDNIWVLYNATFLAKLNNTGTVLWNKQINTVDPMVNATANRQLGFVADLSTEGIKYHAILVDGKSQTIYKINYSGDIVTKTSVPGVIVNGDFTGFDYQRRFIKPTVDSNSLRVKILTKDSTVDSPVPKLITLSANVSSLNTGWHHFAITYDETNKAKFYVDGDKVDESLTTNNILYRIYNYNNNPQILLGATSFKTVDSLGEYIKHIDRFIYNGKIADFRFYNKTLTDSDIKALSRYYLENQFIPLNWNSTSGQRSYIEEIDRFFIHRLPGQKSQYFDIKIKNSTITDTNVKSIIESNIKNILSQNTPVYANLRNIVWE